MSLTTSKVPAHAGTIQIKFNISEQYQRMWAGKQSSFNNKSVHSWSLDSPALKKKKLLRCRGVPCLNRQLAQTWVTPSKKTEYRRTERQTSNIADEATPTTHVGPMERKQIEMKRTTSLGVALSITKKRTRLRKSINKVQQADNQRELIYVTDNKTSQDSTVKLLMPCLAPQHPEQPPGPETSSDGQGSRAEGRKHARGVWFNSHFHLCLTNSDKTQKTPYVMRRHHAA